MDLGIEVLGVLGVRWYRAFQAVEGTAIGCLRLGRSYARAWPVAHKNFGAVVTALA